jgi:hypothetical protein
MPPLTRWFIKTSLICFVAALLVGVALMAQSGLGLSIPIPSLGPVFFHLFMVGWVAQLIFGVVYWMFPKYSREKPRGSESLGWATYILLNAGLLFRFLGEPLHTAQPEARWGWLLAVSAVAQWLAGLAFVANTWGRVKER